MMLRSGRVRSTNRRFHSPQPIVLQEAVPLGGQRMKAPKIRKGSEKVAEKSRTNAIDYYQMVRGLGFFGLLGLSAWCTYRVVVWLVAALFG
jgi:hypothetical protein